MPPRRIVHIEIPTEDRDEAGRFYAEMFGWKFQHLPQMNYSVFEGDGIGGGLTNIDGKLFQGNDLLVYVASEDIDADLKRAQELGAKKIMGKTEVPGFGQFAIVREPSGNRLGFWKSTR